MLVGSRGARGAPEGIWAQLQCNGLDDDENFNNGGSLRGAFLITSTSQAQELRVQRGRAFAQTNCASCHAIGRVGESHLRIAPPFRTLHLRYPVENLVEALAEGIRTAHPTMPQFQLDPAQIGDLMAYLKSLAGLIRRGAG